jgi:hypothetical protein
LKKSKIELEVSILETTRVNLDKKSHLEKQLLESQILESKARAAYFKAATQAISAKMPLDFLDNYLED